MEGCRIRGRFWHPSIAESDFEVLLTNLLVFQTTHRHRFPPAHALLLRTSQIQEHPLSDDETNFLPSSYRPPVRSVFQKRDIGIP